MHLETSSLTDRDGYVIIGVTVRAATTIPASANSWDSAPRTECRNHSVRGDFHFLVLDRAAANRQRGASSLRRRARLLLAEGSSASALSSAATWRGQRLRGQVGGSMFDVWLSLAMDWCLWRLESGALDADEVLEMQTMLREYKRRIGAA